ncbi:class I SAM-dependent methyltransferase [Shewanella sp. S23-S33]|uniref:class I SAM-dependent methyltransferase n=1 Tax=Shewanella sp. S23-S33 TaxID=3342769 RepID=UPI00372D4F15
MPEQVVKTDSHFHNNVIIADKHTSEHQDSASKELIIIKSEPQSSKPSSTIWGTDITAVGSFLTVIFSLAVALSTIRKYSKDSKHQIQLLERDKHLDRVAKAKEKIEKFYGPLNSLLEESRVIYSYFALEEKKELKAEGSYFRTLRFLTDKPDNTQQGLDRFKKSDQELFKHILSISDKVINLIESQSGYVDNPALHILLGKLAAHYRVIKTAAEGKLHGQSEALESIVFPLEINGAINSEISKLLRLIKKTDDKKPKVLKNRTIAFYDTNATSYFDSTIALDMEEIYKKVRAYVPNGGSVLDAGCGVGRDTQYFIRKGFKVLSFDASSKMVELCNQYPFSFCEQKNFTDIDYPSTFDLIWACASLLHLKPSEFEAAISRLLSALTSGGHFYFSLKKQIDNTKAAERDFYTYSSDYIHELLVTRYKLVKIEVWESGSILSNNETFVNYLYKKPSLLGIL